MKSIACGNTYQSAFQRGASPLRAFGSGQRACGVGRRRFSVRAATDTSLTGTQSAALAAGALFNPIVLYSEWTLFSTGKGLDPGPGGLYGAAEGIGAQPFFVSNDIQRLREFLPAEGRLGFLTVLRMLDFAVIGFLVVPGIVIYSLVTKARTGSGLPAGPSGALGAVEGLSWLTSLLGIAVFANEFISKGGLPGITG